MMWTKIYHPNWGPVFLHALITSGVLIAAIAVTLYGVVMWDMAIIAWTGGGLLAYLACLLALLGVVEAAVRRPIARRGESTEWLTSGAAIRLPFAIFLTAGVYLSAVLLANFKRRVTWRGVTYFVRGPFDIILERDSPMTPAQPESGSSL